MQALQLRPDRIVIGEIEANNVAAAMFAFNSVPSMATLQITGGENMVEKLISMQTDQLQAIDMSGLHRRVSLSVGVIVECARDFRGRRIVTDIYVMEETSATSIISVFTRRNPDHLYSTGHVPKKAMAQIEACGIYLPPHVFGGPRKLSGYSQLR
jgi:Flp pilus assembly CpaF family ATPase